MSDPKTTRLDESAHRRADFTTGRAVTLADGQEWQLRKPIVRFAPDDAAECGFQVRLSLPGDRTFADLSRRRESLFGPDGRATIGELAAAELAMGRLLLLANYDLTPDEVASLLQFSYDDDDPDGVELREAVMRVAEGRGPKPSPAGNAPSPTPAGDSPGATG
jgi:hypothetical protein